MKRRRALLLCAAIFAAGCAACLLWVFLFHSGGADVDAVQAQKQALTDLPSSSITAEVPYESPIDFDQLQQTNPDIYAWLEIPDTEISYPVLQREGDDEYYLRRGVDENYATAGCLFTQGSYNGLDFTDPVTIIYGHNMSDGSMFGTLQSMYSTEEGFQTYSEIVVYLPESELHYQVFAAVPYSDIHILYNYDFENSRQSSAFFDSVFAVRAIGAQFSGDTEIGTEDCVLILSTCLHGDSSSRYLVLAKLYETVST